MKPGHHKVSARWCAASTRVRVCLLRTENREQFLTQLFGVRLIPRLEYEEPKRQVALEVIGHADRRALCHDRMTEPMSSVRGARALVWTNWLRRCSTEAPFRDRRARRG